MSSPTPTPDPDASDPGTPRRGVPKLMLVLGTAVPVILVLAAGARTWVHGTVSDAVLADSRVSVTGSQASSGVVATALVAAAALLAALTGGRIVRWIGGVVLTLAGLMIAGMAVRVLLDPESVVGAQAAQRTGRTGSVEATGSTTVWVVLVVLAGVALVVCGLAALVSARSWGGLSSRYESPAVEADRTERATPAESDWERLSRGEDPT